MKIIVFGGSGFLGSHVADVLTEQGHEVVIFDKRKSIYLQQGQEMIIGDMLVREQVEAAIEKCQIVYDFAGIADLDNASTRPIDTIQQNVIGTCVIMDACIKYNIKRFIYASSYYVHSDKGGFYRCSKQTAEIYIEEYSRKFALKYTILRYGSLYGTRADASNGLYKILYEAVKKKKILYSGTGDEIREYINVKDAAELSVKILDKQYEKKHIVLAGNNSYKANDLFIMIQEILGTPLKVEYANNKSEIHYNITPYVFKPQYSYKLIGDYYRDIGEGIVECLYEIEKKDKGWDKND